MSIYNYGNIYLSSLPSGNSSGGNNTTSSQNDGSSEGSGQGNLNRRKTIPTYSPSVSSSLQRDSYGGSSDYNAGYTTAPFQGDPYAGGSDCDAPKTDKPKSDDSGKGSPASVPVPLGIIQGGDQDGYLSYRPAGANPNDDNQIKYARPLGQEQKGPHGEAMFEFDGGKQGYQTKDPQDPNHAKNIIQFTDPSDADHNRTADNEDTAKKATDDLNKSQNKDGDISKILNEHAKDFETAANPDNKGIIGRQDWENFAKGNDDPKIDSQVQDPLERGKMRAAAQTVNDRIHKADGMSMSDAINCFRDKKGQQLIDGQSGTTYERMNKIATGEAALNSVPKDQREHVREAAAKILYSPMSQDERKLSANGKNHIDESKYSQAQGGPTMFSFLDNAFGSTDQDGSFKLKNFSNIQLDQKDK